MKSKGYYINLLGIIFGILSFLIIVLSLTFIIKNRAYFRHHRFTIRGLERIEREIQKGMQRIEGEEVVKGGYRNISIKNISGKIRVSTWNEDYFLIKYMKIGPTLASIEALEVEVETDKKSVYIKRESSVIGLKNLGSISFEVFVPDSVTHLSVESVSGSIELTGMHNGISQKLKTVSSRIETDNSADLTAKSTSGSITFQFSGKNLSIRTVSGRIDGILTNVSSSGSMDLASVSGSIHLHTETKFDAVISLKSISGTVSCDHPMTVSIKKKNQLEGKIGEGTTPLNVKTTSGSIKIQTL